MVESRVSSRYQLTLPAEVRKALGVKPGDAVRYEVEGSSVRVSLVRPDLSAVLDEVTGDYSFEALSDATQDDAVGHLRRERGLADANDG